MDGFSDIFDDETDVFQKKAKVRLYLHQFSITLPPAMALFCDKISQKNAYMLVKIQFHDLAMAILTTADQMPIDATMFFAMISTNVPLGAAYCDMAPLYELKNGI